MTELINKYKNGKVYKIEPIVDHDDGDIYIGSTCQPYLSSRMNQHRRQRNKINGCKSNLLFDKYGVENCNIILIESIEANNKMELQQREAHYIKTLKCVNKCIPLRTDKEYKKDNKEQIKEQKKIYAKEYRKNNKNNISIKRKKIYLHNKNKILEQQRLSYEANKDARNARRRELYKLKKQQEQLI